MKLVIKLHQIGDGKPVLIGTPSIISVEGDATWYKDTQPAGKCTKIDCRAGMVSRFLVKESVEEIYNLCEGKSEEL